MVASPIVQTYRLFSFNRQAMKYRKPIQTIKIDFIFLSSSSDLTRLADVRILAPASLLSTTMPLHPKYILFPAQDNFSIFRTDDQTNTEN